MALTDLDRLDRAGFRHAGLDRAGDQTWTRTGAEIIKRGPGNWELYLPHERFRGLPIHQTRLLRLLEALPGLEGAGPGPEEQAR